MKNIFILFILVFFVVSCQSSVKDDVESSLDETDYQNTSEQYSTVNNIDYTGDILLFEKNNTIYVASTDGKLFPLYALPKNTMKRYYWSDTGILQIAIYGAYLEIDKLIIIDLISGDMKELSLPYNSSDMYVSFASISPNGKKTLIHHTDNLDLTARRVSDVWIYDYVSKNWSRINYDPDVMSPGIGEARRSWSNDSKYLYFINMYTGYSLDAIKLDDPLIYRYNFQTEDFSVFLYKKDVCPGYESIINVMPSTYDDNMIYEVCYDNNYDETILLRYKMGYPREIIANASTDGDDQLGGADYILSKIVSPDNRYILLLQDSDYLFDMQNNEKRELPFNSRISDDGKYQIIGDLDSEGPVFSLSSKYMYYHEFERISISEFKDTLKILSLDSFVSTDISSYSGSYPDNKINVIAWMKK